MGITKTYFTHMVIIRCPEESERLFQMERSSFDGQQFTIMKKLRAHNSEIIVFIILGRKNLAICIGTRNNIIYIGEIDHDEDYKKNT